MLENGHDTYDTCQYPPNSENITKRNFIYPTLWSYVHTAYSTSHHRFYFCFFFLPVYHNLILVTIFQVFASLSCYAASAGIPPFPVFNDPPEYRTRVLEY